MRLPVSPLCAEFGRRLQDRRKALGLYQREIAAELGMHRTQYVMLEKGHLGRIQLDQLRILAEVLQTSADYLLTLKDDAGLGPRESVAMHRQRS